MVHARSIVGMVSFIISAQELMYGAIVGVLFRALINLQTKLMGFFVARLSLKEDIQGMQAMEGFLFDSLSQRLCDGDVARKWLTGLFLEIWVPHLMLNEEVFVITAKLCEIFVSKIDVVNGCWVRRSPRMFTICSGPNWIDGNAFVFARVNESWQHRNMAIYGLTALMGKNGRNYEIVVNGYWYFLMAGAEMVFKPTMLMKGSSGYHLALMDVLGF